MEPSTPQHSYPNILQEEARRRAEKYDSGVPDRAQGTREGDFWCQNAGRLAPGGFGEG
jgi:hypothetical protein